MRFFRRLRPPVLVIAALLAAAAPAASQTRATTADLSGIVVDETKAVLAGATVTATNVATGLARKAVSDRDGHYLIPALPPGTYTIRAEMQGFTSKVVENVALALGEAAALDVMLTLGGASETVTVVAASSAMDVHATAVSAVVSQQQIGALPINVRNWMSFSLLTPGVTTDRNPQSNPTTGLSFAGQRGRSNNIMVDGLDNVELTVGSVRATFSQEAVREFQVIANSFSAEFGKASGGVVNIVTKSGTNKVAGNAFVYFRDEALNAKEHFEKFLPGGTSIDQAKAPYSQVQVGGTVGGPIRRNRSFFFLSAERLRVHANNFVNIDEKTPIVVFGQDYGTMVDILRRDGFPVELGHVLRRLEADQVLGKMDANLRSRHELTLRFNWAAVLDESLGPWGGQVARSRGAAMQTRDLMGAASLRSTFSPRTFNEVRFLIADRRQNLASLDPTCDGPCDLVTEGGPTVEIGAVAAGRQRFTPQPRDNRRFQLVDTLSTERGRHSLKAGFDASYVDHVRFAFPIHVGGRYVFQDLSPSAALGLPGPVNAAEAFALGLPAMYTQAYTATSRPADEDWVGMDYGDLSLFAEDDWRAGTRLTLTLGVRYQKQFWQSTTWHVPGLAPYSWPADNNNVAPRLGVSWQPFPDRQTSVHGFYGVFYDNVLTSLWALPTILTGTPDGVRTRVLRGAEAVEAWQAPGRKLPEPTTPYASSSSAIDPALKTSYAHHASVGIERSFKASLVMSADVVYVRGLKEVGAIEYNPITQPRFGGRPLDVDGKPGTSASLTQYTSWGETWYRGLVVSLRKRLGGRVEFLASYTFSKAEDTAADFAFLQPQDNGLGRNPADPTGLPLGFEPRLERALSLEDQRHRFVFSGTCTAPAGITVSTIVLLGSGRPYNIVAGSDLNKDGDATADRPWRVENDPTTRIGRNAGMLPAQFTVDLRVAKTVVLGGRAKLDLMVEIFNLFNRTNYTEANAVFGSKSFPDNPNPTFGQFTKAAPPFQAQLAAKISF